MIIIIFYILISEIFYLLLILNLLLIIIKSSTYYYKKVKSSTFNQRLGLSSLFNNNNNKEQIQQSNANIPLMQIFLFIEELICACLFKIRCFISPQFGDYQQAPIFKVVSISFTRINNFCRYQMYSFFHCLRDQELVGFLTPILIQLACLFRVSSIVCQTKFLFLVRLA